MYSFKGKVTLCAEIPHEVFGMFPVTIDVTETWQSRFVHAPNRCGGESCPFHKPSKHHMRDWPLNVRADRNDCLTERICAHGTGHPDPDSLAFLQRPGGWGNEYSGVHGCDGCCHAANADA